MFFATLSSKNTGSALPLRIILEILTVSNVYRLHALKFVHAWHKGILPELINHFVQYASNIQNPLMSGQPRNRLVGMNL